MNPSGAPRAGGGRFGSALAALRHEVTDGRFRDRDMLPGERELSDILGVSRTTLRRVLAGLAEEGLLTQRHGVGTFIARGTARVEPSPGRLIGFTEDMRRRGANASSRELGRGIFLPSPEEAMMLACSPGDSVLRLSRVRYADEVPIVVEHAAVPVCLFADPEAIGPSLYAALERHGVRPVRALQRVQAAIISDVDAARLNVPAHSPALQVRRTSYMADGRCCEFTRATYRSDRYDLVSELRGTAEGQKESSP